MPETRLLVIEDDPDIADLLLAYFGLRQEYTLFHAADGQEGIALARTQHPTLILLDVMLPDMTGWQVAEALRATALTRYIPIIFLSQLSRRHDRLHGLELGADDYITKPFSPRVVVARVRAALRRSEAPAQPTKLIHAADLEIDPQAFRLLRAGQEIELTPTEFNLLAVLARQPGRAFTRLQLLEDALGTAYEGYERTIDAHIKNLRAKIEPDPRHPIYIETVFGVGYRFRRE